MIAQTVLFDETWCVFIDGDKDTDEDEMSDGGSDYGEDGEDGMVDEVLKFDEDDVGSFASRANYFLDDPKSVKFIGMNAVKSEDTKNLLSEKSDGRHRNLSTD